MINPMTLEGKTILITGASDGIGKETALLASKLGAKIILVARSEEKLRNTMDTLEGKGHRWYSFDLKEIDKIESLIKNVVTENGALDGFVHCAGISTMRPLKNTNHDFLQEMMLINFYSFVELTRLITKKGNYNKGMSIVAMSSIGGIRGDKSKTAYSSSKAALDGAIRSMSKELGAKNIRVNSIVSGIIKTDMFKRFMEKTGKDEFDSQFDKYILGLGVTEDVANAIAFLLSDASRIITGTGLVIDSGATT
ncbi:MAG: SDR family NAD(P)-dependent oxidoreductase [Candidatus Woesearchaeota archaeon]